MRTLLAEIASPPISDVDRRGNQRRRTPGKPRHSIQNERDRGAV